MKKLKNNKYMYLVLIIFMFLCIFLIYNKNSDVETKLEQVELSNKDSVLPKDLFAIMISDEDGNYSESTSNTFPSSGYTFNAELSGCMDAKGSLVSDILTYDASKNLVTVSTDTTVYCYLYFDIIVDTEPPTNNSVLINNGDSYTSSTSVTLTLASTDVAEMCISNTDSCSSWENYGTSKSWTLTTGDGTKTIYVWFRDEYGNTSKYVTDTITLDTAAPTSNSVKINNNATYTTSTSVTLTLASTGATQMCISNTTSCSSWVTYATSKSHTLTSGDGTKTVYVWFKDAAGNQTSYVTDTITLDTQAPTSNSVKINNNAASTTSTSVTLTLASTGASQMCISNTTSCSSWVTYTTSKSHTLTSGDGTKTVYVWYRDAAGNTTNYVTDTITLNTTTYLCTTNTAFGTCLKSAKTTGFNSTMTAGLYRYHGTTNVNNYVCFGTTTKSTCTGNTDRYMYRIIGVDSSGQIKLIKKEALNSTLQWYASYSTNITWPNSTIYTNINGSSFYTNTTYVPTSWQSKIATYSWKYGDVEGSADGVLDITPSNLYAAENGWSSTTSAKIGLIYMHDYYYAYQSGGLNCDYYKGSYTLCKASWLHISNNDSAPPGNNDTTMSRYGYHFNQAEPWYIRSYGDPNMGLSNITGNVRPVFFLTSSVKYISGSGTALDPFIIS